MTAQRDETDAIRARLRAIRSELPEDLADARREVRRKLSVRHQASKHPYLVIVGMLVLGYMIVPRRKIVRSRSTVRLRSSRPAWLSRWGDQDKHADRQRSSKFASYGSKYDESDDTEDVVTKSSVVSLITSALTSFAVRAVTGYATNRFLNRSGGGR
ncbi:hypothetical protein SH139x_005265 [Planctomycetaceae bacterium SH139]